MYKVMLCHFFRILIYALSLLLFLETVDCHVENSTLIKIKFRRAFIKCIVYYRKGKAARVIGLLSYNTADLDESVNLSEVSTSILLYTIFFLGMP